MWSSAKEYLPLSKVTKQDLSVFELTVECNLDIPNRRIYIDSEIDEDSVALALKGLHYLDGTTGDIEIMINSGGGDVYGAGSIYDSIRSCNNKTITIGTGAVASAAGLLLVCGDERYATPNCFFMAHEGTLHFTEDEMVAPTTLLGELKHDTAMSDEWCNTMAEHTAHGKKWWRDHSIKPKEDLWFNQKEMVVHGIIDSVWPITT